MAGAPIVKAFRELKITVAVDKSGSTVGRTLVAELSAIDQILQLLPDSDRDKVPILPWSDEFHDVWSFSRCSRLTSGGGTDPGVLYQSSASLAALQASDLWFLLTDGQIYDNLVENFAVRTAQLGLHNRGCVIIVFGSTTQGPPAECDISVGKAAYALAPDCLFLFHDKDTSKLLILQAKGAFRRLFSRHGKTVAQPQLNYYTTWGDLPQMSYEDLALIEIHPKQQVGQDEMILHNEAVLNIQDLYSGLAEAETVEVLLKNQDNLKSLVMAEMMRGRGEKLQEWLDSQQTAIPEMTKERIDVDGAAQDAITSLLNTWNDIQQTTNRSVFQQQLRHAHAKNRKVLGGHADVHKKKVKETVRRNTYVVAARSQSIQNTPVLDVHPPDFQPSVPYAPRRSSNSQSLSAGWDGIQDDDQDDVLSRSTARIPHHPKRDMTVIRVLNEVFLPGFKRATKDTSEHKGKCMLCLDTALLTILLTAEGEEVATENFPRRGSATILTYPLAMSPFAETNILSYFICCDACAFHLVRNFTAPSSERVVAALPLVDIEANKDAWIVTLDKAFKGRFSQHCILQVFIASLDQKLENNRDRVAPAEEKDSFHSAASWLQQELPKYAIAAPLLSPAFHKGKSKHKNHKTLSMLLENEAFIDPALPSNKDIAMLRYPMPGFAVIMRLLSLRGTPIEKIQQFVFLRLLFEITTTVLGEAGAEDWQIDDIKPLNTTVPLSVPAQSMVNRKLLSSENFVELSNLASANGSQGWQVSGIDAYLQKLLELKGEVKDPVIAFNTLKEDSTLQHIMNPVKK